MATLTTLLPVLGMGWYALFMLVAVPLLAVGWVAYYLWNKKMEALEEEEKKKGSRRLREARSEVSDWAKKMAEFKGPPKRPPSPES